MPGSGLRLVRVNMKLRIKSSPSWLEPCPSKFPVIIITVPGSIEYSGREVAFKPDAEVEPVIVIAK